MSVQAELKMGPVLSQFPFEMLFSVSFVVPLWFWAIISFKEDTTMFLWTETIHTFVAKCEFSITGVMFSISSLVYA